MKLQIQKEIDWKPRKGNRFSVLLSAKCLCITTRQPVPYAQCTYVRVFSSHFLCTQKQTWKINRFWIASEWNVILHFLSIDVKGTIRHCISIHKIFATLERFFRATNQQRQQRKKTPQRKIEMKYGKKSEKPFIHAHWQTQDKTIVQTTNAHAWIYHGSRGVAETKKERRKRNKKYAWMNADTNRQCRRSMASELSCLIEPNEI